MPKNPRTHLTKNSPGSSMDAQRRIGMKATTLATHLKGYSKTELEMLVRYYIHGEDEQSIAAQMGIDPERLAALRARLRNLVVSASPRAKSAATGGFSGY